MIYVREFFGNDPKSKKIVRLYEVRIFGFLIWRMTRPI